MTDAAAPNQATAEEREAAIAADVQTLTADQLGELAWEGQTDWRMAAINELHDRAAAAEAAEGRLAWYERQRNIRAEAAGARVKVLETAARALYERVEMDESVGICLSDRVPSLNLGKVLAAASPAEEAEGK